MLAKLELKAGTSDARKLEITEAVRDYMTRTETSQNRTAGQIGVSPATLSSILNHQWERISDEMWQKVAGYVFKFVSRGWKIVETANFRRIFNLCRDAKLNAEMRIIAGYSGAGKTLALREFKLRNPNVFIVTCLDGDSKKDFLEDILRELGVKFKGTCGQTVRKIAEELNAMDAPILIFDEAGALGGKKIQLIKDLRNLTEGSCGIVLSGVDYVYSNIAKHAKSEREGYPELFSRIGYCAGLEPPTWEEVRRIAESNGVADEAIAKFLYQNCKDFRLVKSWVENCHKLGDRLSLDYLKDVFNHSIKR